MQKTFNPIDFGFRWTGDGWYEWDDKAAHKAAMKARNAEAKRLVLQGKQVKKTSSPNQMITMGGIGTPYPQISEYVTVYTLNAF